MSDIKIGELITKLQAIKDTHGDLVVLQTNENNGLTGISDPHVSYTYPRNIRGDYKLLSGDEEVSNKHIKVCSIDCEY